ncbi:hypothetical protein GALL_430290 [mine drainage metagenome]|uniref:Uncharacterized protein n=1 Tax=mine drainage metagenome TaxID=410659 RepID=A0A1J5QH41_9ZZZZ
MPPVLLPESAVLALGYLCLGPARDLALGQDARNRRLDGLQIPDAAVGTLEFGVEFLDPVEGLLQYGKPGLLVPPRHQLAPDPDDPVAFG